MNTNTIKDIYKLNKNISNIKKVSLNEYTINFFIVFVALAALFIMYIKIDLTIDEKNWKVNKCNPKYLFFSGYIQKNPNSTSIDTTIDNFYDCAQMYTSGLNDSLNLPLNNLHEKIKKKFVSFEKSQMNRAKMKQQDIKTDIDKVTKQITELEKDISFNITENSAYTYTYLKNIGYYIDHLNGIMDYIRVYIKNYFTYLMLYNANKYREDTSNQTYYNNTLKLNNIIKQYL